MKTFSALVIKGEGRGRQLGFPTINLDIANLNLELGFGVYATNVNVEGKSYLGAMHYGPRGTFADLKPVMEIYLLDFSGDIYGAVVEVEIIKKNRDVKKFASKEELIQQIEDDVAMVKAFQ